MAKKEYVWLVRYGKTEYPLKENDGPYNSKYRVQVPGTSSPPGSCWYQQPLLLVVLLFLYIIIIFIYTFSNIHFSYL